ncbi:MAG: fasciclin domain-containing protein [Ferruginibacter sp.]
MKNYISLLMLGAGLSLMSCNQTTATKTNSDEVASSTSTPTAGGQENVNDDQSAKDIVKLAVGTPDLSTLVAAIKQAELVTSLSNAGPFTVFAPVNAAFDKLPAGSVNGLMKDDKKDDLQNLLQYHVALGGLKQENFKDGQVLGMANGDNVTIQVKDGKVTLNNSAHITATVQAANGIIYLIDAVLMPPAAK